MVTPQDQFLTSAGPMQEWFDLARKLERRPGVLDVSPYPMQPWLDVAEGGWAVVAHTDNDAGLAQTLAYEMANKAWSLAANSSTGAFREPRAADGRRPAGGGGRAAG